MGEDMKKIICNFCGSDRYEQRQTEYLYSHQGKYLLVPNMPVEMCLDCGMFYYDAASLKQIEQQFFLIQDKTIVPDFYMQIPTKSYR